MDSVRISAWYLPIIEFSGVFTTALAVGVGGWLVHTEAITIGTVTFFLLTLSNLFEPVQQLSQLFNTVQSAGALAAMANAQSPGRSATVMSLNVAGALPVQVTLESLPSSERGAVTVARSVPWMLYPPFVASVVLASFKSTL